MRTTTTSPPKTRSRGHAMATTRCRSARRRANGSPAPSGSACYLIVVQAPSNPHVGPMQEQMPLKPALPLQYLVEPVHGAHLRLSVSGFVHDPELAVLSGTATSFGAPLVPQPVRVRQQPVHACASSRTGPPLLMPPSLGLAKLLPHTHHRHVPGKEEQAPREGDHPWPLCVRYVGE